MAFDMRGRGEAPRRNPYGARSDAEVILVESLKERITAIGGAAAASQRLASWRRKSTERAFLFLQKLDTPLLLSFIADMIDLGKRAIASGDLGNPHTLGEWNTFVSTLEAGRDAIPVK